MIHHDSQANRILRKTRKQSSKSDCCNISLVQFRHSYACIVWYFEFCNLWDLLIMKRKFKWDRSMFVYFRMHLLLFVNAAGQATLLKFTFGLLAFLNQSKRQYISRTWFDWSCNRSFTRPSAARLAAMSIVEADLSWTWFLALRRITVTLFLAEFICNCVVYLWY